MAGDVEGVLGYFSPDIAFTNPGRSPVSGVIRGHDAFREWATLLFKLAEGDFKAAPTEMAAVDDNTILIRFNVQAHRGDDSINQFVLQRMTVEDGNSPRSTTPGPTNTSSTPSSARPRRPTPPSGAKA